MHQTRIFQQPFTPKPFCSGHYIPYITCFFPQPEKPKSRAPSFLEKLATLLFTGLLLLDPSTAKLTHFITQNTSSQALAPDKNIPAAFYTKAFLHRPLTSPYITCFYPQPELLAPDNFYSQPSFTQTPFTTLLFTGLLLLDPFTAKHTLFNTQNTFITKHFLQARHTFTPKPFTPKRLFAPIFTRHFFYTSHLLYQATSSLETFYTRHLLHQTHFTRGTFFYTIGNSTFQWFTSTDPSTAKLRPLHTRSLLHQPTFNSRVPTFKTLANSTFQWLTNQT